MMYVEIPARKVNHIQTFRISFKAFYLIEFDSDEEIMDNRQW